MKISIIIPVYNVAPYLHECLDSIAVAIEEVKVKGQGQQWNVEVICIDDGSTDGSGEILEAWAARWGHRALPSVEIVRQTNRGVAAARNRGLEAASGDWVVFLDGDDLLAPGWMEKLTAGIAAHPEADMILFGLTMFDARGEVGRRGTEFPYSAAFSQFAYRRARFQDVRFPGYTVGEDITYLLRCLRRSHGLARIPEILYRYRQRPGSAMNSAWSLSKRWDDLRHVVHCLGILLVSRGVPLRIYARYVRRIFEKAFALVKP